MDPCRKDGKKKMRNMDYYGEYAYEINADLGISILRYNGSEESVTIPESINGLPVTGIRKHAFTGTDIVGVVVPEGVEVIDDEAFAMCEFLQCVTLPATLQTLGCGVFMGSEEISQIEFPNGNAQYYMEDGMLFSRAGRTLVFCPPGLKKEAVYIPVGTEIIGAYAFYSNRHLQHVKLPLTIKKIESGAFLFTDSMQMIEFPPYIEEIARDSFLVGTGAFAEKQFVIYAFPGSAGYWFAMEQHLPVHLMYAIVTD